LAVLLVVASALHAQTVTTFDVLNSTNTIPQANNLFGQVTGYYQDANFVVHGFLRQPNGTIVTFDAPGSTDTKATGINDLGQITGYYLGPDNASHGFLRQRNGAIITFDAPNSPYPPNPDLCEWQTTDTYSSVINLAGQIAGIHRQRLVGIAGEVCAAIQYQGFLRNPDGTIISFGIFFQPDGGLSVHYVGPHAINLPGQITGSYRHTDLFGRLTGGFLRRPDATITTFLEDPDQRSGTYANSINLFGQITGSFSGADTNYNTRGFLRQPNGNILLFDAPGSAYTVASSFNDLARSRGTTLVWIMPGMGFYDRGTVPSPLLMCPAQLRVTKAALFPRVLACSDR
jgi:uncharacterized membrane protein